MATADPADEYVDHYAALGLPSGEEGLKPTLKAIENARRKHSRNRANATGDFQRLTSSFNVLKDNAKRSSFDAKMRARLEKTAGGPLPGAERRKLACESEEMDAVKRKFPGWKRKLEEFRAWKAKKAVDASALVEEQLCMMRDMMETLQNLQHQNDLLQDELQAAQQRERIDSMIEFRQLHPPTFTGTSGPLEAHKWLMDMKIHLRAARVPEAHKVTAVELQLEGYALDWWEAEEHRLEKPIHWDTFSEKFLERFFPMTVRLDMEREFIKLEQGDRTVDEYDAEFLRLSRFALDYVGQEKDRARRFLQGLTFEIKKNLVVHKWDTYNEVLEAARMQEQILEEMREEESRRCFRSSPQSHVIVCSFCNRTGHVQKNCRRANNQCLYCGADDHQIGDCPRRRY